MTITTTHPTSTTSPTASIPNLGFILDKFVTDTEGALFAQTVSADGMHLASSLRYDRNIHDTFAAIASGLASLTDGSVELFGLGGVTRQIIEATNGWVLLSRLSNTASIGVVASRDADLGLIGYEMAHLAKQLGPMLSPEVVRNLKHSLQV